MRTRRRLLTLSAALVAVGSVLQPVPTSAGTPEPAGSIVLPADHGDVATQVIPVLGDAEGFVVDRRGNGTAEYAYRSMDGTVAFDLPAGSTPVSLVGHQLVTSRVAPGEQFSHELELDQLDTSSAPPTSSVLTDETDISSHGTPPLFLSGTGSGWLSLEPGSHAVYDVVLHDGGAVTTLHGFDPPAGYGLAGPPLVRADGVGAAFVFTLSDGQRDPVIVQGAYLDLAAARADGRSGWDPFSAVSGVVPALTGDRVRFLAPLGTDGRTQLVDARRGATLTDVRAVRVFPAEVHVRDLAAVGDATAWAQDGSSFQDAEGYVQSAGEVVTQVDDAAPAVAVAVPMEHEIDQGAPHVITAGQAFAAAFGDTVGARGLHAVDPGSAEPGAELLAALPVAPAFLDAGPGALTAVGGDRTSTRFYVPQSVSRTVSTGPGGPTTGAPVVESPAEQLCSCSSGFIRGSDSGDRRAFLSMPHDGSSAVVVQQGGRTVMSLPQTRGVSTVSLSGNLLLIGHPGSITLPGLPLPGQPSYSAGSDLVDLDSGTVTAEPGEGVLWGQRIAYRDQDGDIFLRDLSRPGSADLPLRSSSDGLEGDAYGRSDQLQIHGDWVSWRLLSDDQTTATTTIDHVDPLGVIDRSLTLTQHIGADFDLRDEQLGDGFLAYLPPGIVQRFGTDPDVEDDSVHVIDLDLSAPGALVDRVVGTAHSEAQTYAMAASDDFLAFVAPDASIHVQPLALADSPPRLLGSLPAGSTLDADAGTPWVATPDASRPLSSWSFVVSSAQGTVVHRQDGAAPTGAMALRWDGRTDGGGSLPAGDYHWELSGRGQSGELTDALGVPVRLTGTIALSHHPAPAIPPAAGAASVLAPGRVTQSKGDRHVVVGWEADGASAFDVTVADGTLDAHGRVHWTAAKPWLTASPVTSATYSGRPWPIRLGHELRFTVTPTAAGGAGPSASVLVPVPRDDASFTFGPGWTSRHERGAWQGAAHRSASAGSTLRFTTGARGLQVVGPTCRTCGKVAVLVDGVVVATLSAAGPARSQVVLGSVRLGSRPSLRKVQLRTTSSRPVTIDALTLSF